MTSPTPLTALVDYDSGNLHSAEKAFQRMAVETGAGDILVSSRPEDVTRADRIAEALSAGADDYVMKPFDGEILHSKLAEVGAVQSPS